MSRATECRQHRLHDSTPPLARNHPLKPVRLRERVPVDALVRARRPRSNATVGCGTALCRRRRIRGPTSRLDRPQILDLPPRQAGDFASVRRVDFPGLSEREVRRVLSTPPMRAAGRQHQVEISGQGAAKAPTWCRTFPRSSSPDELTPGQHELIRERCGVWEAGADPLGSSDQGRRLSVVEDRVGRQPGDEGAGAVPAGPGDGA
jgi:hypothetical protein